MRETIRKLVIEAITDTDKLTEVVDKLCDLHNASKKGEREKIEVEILEGLLKDTKGMRPEYIVEDIEEQIDIIKALKH